MVGDDAGEIGVPAESGDVVHHHGAQLERAPGHVGLRRVDRERHADAGRPYALEHREDAAKLLVDRYPQRARPGRLPPDVDDPDAFPAHLPHPLHGEGGIEVQAAVGERVGRHVHDAHHARPRQELLHGSRHRSRF